MNNFFAMLYRMRYIDRWGLMNNTRVENISEHSLDVAVLSHALVTIANKRFSANLSADRAAVHTRQILQRGNHERLQAD